MKSSWCNAETTRTMDVFGPVPVCRDGWSWATLTTCEQALSDLLDGCSLAETERRFPKKRVDEEET